MYVKDILCRISKVTFEIPCKISYLYIERCNFYMKLEDLRALEFKGSNAFLKFPLVPITSMFPNTIFFLLVYWE